LRVSEASRILIPIIESGEKEMTKAAVASDNDSLNGTFLNEYNSQANIQKYAKETAGYGISYLLEHEYGDLYLEVLEKHIPKARLRSGIRLWEFGCGGGMNLIRLVFLMDRRGIAWECAYGTDFSEPMIEAAKREAQQCLTPAQNAKVRFCVGRNESLIRDLTRSTGISECTLLQSFDVMVGVNTIRYNHRLMNEKECVGDILALLRDGGVCIAIDMNNKFPAFRSRLRERRQPDDRAYYLPSLEEYARPFSSVGFEILKKQNFCWVPHSAGRGLTIVMKTLTPVLAAFAPSRAMRSLVVSRKKQNHPA
jgi:2-polyprenyl-3-methyl-5-hydroxy-6-metoxy-1,4-benzoquinol methylase